MINPLLEKYHAHLDKAKREKREAILHLLLTINDPDELQTLIHAAQELLDSIRRAN